MELGTEVPSKTWGRGWYDIRGHRVSKAKCNLDLMVLDKRHKQWSRNWGPGSSYSKATGSLERQKTPERTDSHMPGGGQGFSDRLPKSASF